MIERRALLGLAALLGISRVWALPPRTLQFPRDFGSHPDLRTEWWCITAHARSATREFGLQVTFFRSRVDEARAMRSAFAARQLIFAHAVVTDLAGGKLWHDGRIARAGFGVASTSEQDTELRLRDWTAPRRQCLCGAPRCRRIRIRHAIFANAAGATARPLRTVA